MSDIIRTTRRNEWKFEYPVAKVLTGAANKLEYHKGRHAHWLEQFDKIKNKIKDEGIEFDDGLAVDGIANNSFQYASNYRPPQVSIRDNLQSDFEEIKKKVIEHRDKKNNYEGWVKLLSHAVNPDVIPLTKNSAVKKLELTYADWHFFFGE